MSHPATGLEPSVVATGSMRAMAHGTREELARFVHPDGVNREAVDEPPAASTPGPDGFWATALWLRAGFSELDFEVHEVVADGDLVVVHNTMSGRHTGDMVMYREGRVAAVMPATGRRFATTQTHWFRLAGGLVIEHWANRDDFGTAQQLGWVPPTPLFLLRQLLATRRARRAEVSFR